MDRQRVLVVDDDESIRRLFQTALSSAFDVVTAFDGERAKAILADTDVACVVADQMMPGMSGIDLLHYAADARPNAARVLVTASERIKDLSDAVNVARVHRFITKPVRVTELISAVSDAVRVSAIERQNASLVEELREKNTLLQRALVAVQEHERRLEREVAERTAELKAANAELEKLALRDGLTGLYNHRFFQEAMTTELARAARYGNPVGLVFLDVDHFKNYNDLCGHPAGDELLRQLARILVATEDSPEIRFRGRLSDIAARYGGEEFVVILPMTDVEGALTRAERIREMVATHPFPRREVQPSGIISVSIGVAAYPSIALDKVSLIQAADDAMLKAKRTGRNRVVAAAAPGGSR